MQAELWQRVKEAFDTISDLAPADRAVRLSELDIDTRREVERLLAT